MQAAIRLRDDYQVPLKANTETALVQHKDVLMVLATGGGKTVVFSSIVNDHVGASCTVVHRKEIVKQISLTLATFGIKHRIIAPSSVRALVRRAHLKKFGKIFIDDRAERAVASAQTLASKSTANNHTLQQFIKRVTLALFDEGHHYKNTGHWSRAVNAFEAARRLFITATPSRADGTGLGAHAGGYAKVMVEGPQTGDLIEEGYLAPYKYFAPECGFDASDIPITAEGDVNTRYMRQRVQDANLVGKAVTHYQKFTPGKTAILFANDIASAEEHLREFRAAGITAEFVHGDTEDALREKAIERFENRETMVLINVDLFDEGLDVPGAEVCIMARLTLSLNKYMQMCGRVLRPVYAAGVDMLCKTSRLAHIAEGAKPFAFILDMVGNWIEHVSPSLRRKWTLDGSQKRRGSSAPAIRQYVCLECTQPFPRVLLTCPSCGAAAPEPDERDGPDKVDGDLVCLSESVLKELLARVAHARMSREEYERDQLRRGIPQIGRGADMRRHEAVNYRRDVLDNLIAYWMGSHPPGRDMREKYRRFYHRFGVDVVSAFLLNIKDTDALIDLITEKFAEDLI